MRQKLLVCLLVIFILAFGIAPNLFDERDSLQPPLRSIAAHKSADLLVLAPNFRLIFHDVLRHGSGNIRFLTLFRQQLDLILFNFINRVAVLFLCQFIFGFFIFYQIARTSSKQDDPVLINGLS